MASLIHDVTPGIQLRFEPHTLLFKRPSGTSRGILTEKRLWLLRLTCTETGISGLGECSIIEGLSPDFESVVQYESKLSEVCDNPVLFLSNPELLSEYPSILFGLEAAYLDWKNGGTGRYFSSEFTEGTLSIPINGLIWMGDEGFMHEQIEEKVAHGYSCIKMKVGAIDFDTEIRLLEGIRKRFSAEQMVLRVDANGAFSSLEALNKLKQLAALDIHSIEQPIPAGNWKQMAQLCAETPLDIALDEELIGINLTSEKRQLLREINPQFIILKPSLHGGFSGTQEWITLADEYNIPWWITSALESNIGLSAIAQFTAQYPIHRPQGLGTGSLFQSNFDSTMYIQNGKLFHH